MQKADAEKHRISFLYYPVNNKQILYRVRTRNARPYTFIVWSKTALPNML